MKYINHLYDTALGFSLSLAVVFILGATFLYSVPVWKSVVIGSIFVIFTMVYGIIDMKFKEIFKTTTNGD